MQEKTMSVSLGGQERVLMYGTMGYFNYIKEVTKKEPFDWLNEISKSGEENNVTMFSEDAAVIIYAGLNSYLDSKDEANVPFEKVKKWCNALTADQMAPIIKTSFEAISVPGEAKSQDEAKPGTS